MISIKGPTRGQKCEISQLSSTEAILTNTSWTAYPESVRSIGSWCSRLWMNFREIEILITHASTQHQAATCMISISKTHETQISWYIDTCSQEMSCTPWQNKYRNINDKHRQYWIKTTQTIIKRAWTRTLRALSTKKMKSQMTSLKSSSVKSPMIPIITPKRMRARTRRSKVNL